MFDHFKKKDDKPRMQQTSLIKTYENLQGDLQKLIRNDQRKKIHNLLYKQGVKLVQDTEEDRRKRELYQSNDELLRKQSKKQQQKQAERQKRRQKYQETFKDYGQGLKDLKDYKKIDYKLEDPLGASFASKAPSNQ